MKNELKKEIGRKLRRFRKRKGLTQAEIVSYFNIGRANYSRIEKGEVFPNFMVLHALKKKLNLSLDWLIAGEEEIAPGETVNVYEWRRREQLNREIAEMLDMMEKAPMVRHAVLSFYLEYRSNNEKIIKMMINESETSGAAESKNINKQTS